MAATELKGVFGHVEIMAQDNLSKQATKRKFRIRAGKKSTDTDALSCEDENEEGGLCLMHIRKMKNGNNNSFINGTASQPTSRITDKEVILAS